MAYEDTVFDRAKLDRYAKRVARELGGTGPTTKLVESVEKVPTTTTRWFGLRTETSHQNRTVSREVPVPASRWFLDQRTVTSRTNYSRSQWDDDHSVERYYLEWDGRLVVDWKSWEEGSTDGMRWGPSGNQAGSRPMSDDTILLFDHDFLDPSRRIRVHAKGVGLSLRLKKLLELGHPGR